MRVSCDRSAGFPLLMEWLAASESPVIWRLSLPRRLPPYLLPWRPSVSPAVGYDNGMDSIVSVILIGNLYRAARKVGAGHKLICKHCFKSERLSRDV